jgi:hypothetical protein
MYRRSESMIALRARRQAYAVASDILYPPAEVPPPASPQMPVAPEDEIARMKREYALRLKEFERSRRKSRFLMYCSLFLLIMLVLSALAVALFVT